MRRRNVFISGLGLITPLGSGNQTFWQRLLSGESSIRPANEIFRFPIDLAETPLHTAAPLVFQPGSAFDLGLPKPMYWGDRLLCNAAQMAIEDAGLQDLPRDTAVILGAGASSTLNIEDFEAQLEADIAAGQRISKIPQDILSSEKIVANTFNLVGPSLMIATACSSSSHAVGYGFDLIASGACDCAVVGAADTLCQMTQSGFYGLKSISPGNCRPFDRDRNGISIGECAIVLILETSERLRARGKDPYCCIAGYSANCDAGRMTSPDESGEALFFLMQKALNNAVAGPAEVDYVCAHGTGTVLNDLTEAKAIDLLFGSCAPPVSSIKGAVGHCMAAAGIFNCAAVALALKHQVMPPNTGMVNRDEQCPVNVLTDRTEGELNVAMANAFGFGGNNTCLVFRRMEAGGAS